MEGAEAKGWGEHLPFEAGNGKKKEFWTLAKRDVEGFRTLMTQQVKEEKPF